MGERLSEALLGNIEDEAARWQERRHVMIANINEVRALVAEVRLSRAASSGYTIADRLRDVADEACGLQPVITADEALTLIERKLSEQRIRIVGLEAQLHAAPTPLTPDEREGLAFARKVMAGNPSRHVLGRAALQALARLLATDGEGGGR